jgi:hypothetical protein
MKTQIIQDHNGLPAGVFIPIEDWENLKKNYPNIEKIVDDLPQWQKEILDTRLNDLGNPAKIKPINYLYNVLDEDQ